MISRAPQGARGLKYCYYGLVRRYVLSRPARGAWVEILILIDEIGVLRRAPQGARGLKFGIEEV